jgi:hypothetical protein
MPASSASTDRELENRSRGNPQRLSRMRNRSSAACAQSYQQASPLSVRVDAILAGNQRADVDRAMPTAGALPASWAEQAKMILSVSG